MKHLNLKDLKDYSEILAFITDEMADNSDLEGDKDPEDALPDQNTTPNDFSIQDMEESFHSCPNNDAEDPIIINGEDHLDESDVENFDITWGKKDKEKKEKKTTPPTSFSNFQFCQNYGNAVTVNSHAPNFTFSLLFPSTYMNLYASQHHVSLDLTTKELKAFFSLFIVMGLNKLQV
ncbi:hypothetical protein AVEN_188154-1 [Araneus ventricosus]|uniref:Uncharacterized protein n=1 Tax=Araneus ventricosus TaxID=182803 RepID=A0A4Y2IMB2_ARAVE|nr:hypothetical protein AVEN_224661-1 [Araneus ventricosus]GBM78963.1 hypothetical protein AVEN_188154-1 [Araneus ventricosus]